MPNCHYRKKILAPKYQIDDTDRKILKELTKDGRVSFLEIAQKLNVSGGTIHQRVNKMKLAGVIKGFIPVLEKQQLGLEISAMIGVHLKNAKDCGAVLEKLNRFPEVFEAHYTTGTYALIVKVSTTSMPEFHSFLIDKLQSISEIQSTESFICLSTPIEKNIKF